MTPLPVQIFGRPISTGAEPSGMTWPWKVKSNTFTPSGCLGVVAFLEVVVVCLVAALAGSLAAGLAEMGVLKGGKAADVFP